MAHDGAKGVVRERMELMSALRQLGARADALAAWYRGAGRVCPACHKSCRAKR